MALPRITVTVPRSLVREADRLARRESRSRSWVVAEALRQYLAGVAPVPAGTPGAVRSGAPAGLDAAAARVRADHLASALALPPSARVERAEELGRLARGRQQRGRRQQVIAFESYDDYYRWKTGRLIGA